MASGDTGNHPMRTTCCPCGCSDSHNNSDISRRGFLQGVGGATVFGAALTGLTWASVAAAEAASPQSIVRKPLVVKPILTYDSPQPRPQTSWRSWGGVHGKEAAEKELKLIKTELAAMKKNADFPIEFLPCSGVQSRQELAQVGDLDQADAYIALRGRQRHGPVRYAQQEGQGYHPVLPS